MNHRPTASIGLLFVILASPLLSSVNSFTSISHVGRFNALTCYRNGHRGSATKSKLLRSQAMKDANIYEEKTRSVWEDLARLFHPNFAETMNDPEEMKAYAQSVTFLRVGVPGLFLAASANIAYPHVAIALANLINDSGVFAVVSQDSSQYIQNVLTTSGLVFSIIAGQTYYFMYQQQEAIYLALFDEVTTAKSLLEQVALVSQGRQQLYEKLLACVQEYVEQDLTKFNDIEPAGLLSSRPVDDPLQEILYLTSVGEPSLVYQTVKSLRQARAYRLGALQRKLPQFHMYFLWTLAGIVLFTFPLLGAGVQTIGGMGILKIQAWYLSFIVFGICIVIGLVNELRKPGEMGAYNARTVLNVMVAGLEEELELRQSGVLRGPPAYMEPSVDNIGSVLTSDTKSSPSNDIIVTASSKSPTLTTDSGPPAYMEEVADNIDCASSSDTPPSVSDDSTVITSSPSPKLASDPAKSSAEKEKKSSKRQRVLDFFRRK